MLKSILEKENIEFEICDDMDKMLSKGIKSVPVMEVGDRLLNYEEVISEIPNLK
jgi:hypothetical protein